MDDIIIREIPYNSEMYKLSMILREDILRKPLGLTLSHEDVAGESEQIHIAAIRNSETVAGTAVLRFLPQDKVKIRQMAVLSSLQGLGLGSEIMKFCQTLAKTRKCRTATLAARKTAWNFYKKLGYTPEGKEYFELVTLPCITMVKAL